MGRSGVAGRGVTWGEWVRWGGQVGVTWGVWVRWEGQVRLVGRWVEPCSHVQKPLEHTLSLKHPQFEVQF